MVDPSIIVTPEIWWSVVEIMGAVVWEYGPLTLEQCKASLANSAEHVAINTNDRGFTVFEGKVIHKDDISLYCEER